MSPSDRRRNLLNILTVVLIVLTIIAAYFYITNPANQSEEILSVEQVVGSSDQYLNSQITVEGFYYHGTHPKGQGDITSEAINPYSSSFSESVQYLLVNHSNVNMTLVEGVKYRFKGLLISDPSAPAGTAIILVADEIAEV